MIGARHFDAHDQVLQVMLLAGLSQLADGEVELRALMFDGRWWDENFTVEVGEHPLGSGFGTIDGDDAKVFGSDLLDSRLDHTVWFAENSLTEFTGSTACAFFARLNLCSHSNGLLVKKH